MVYDDAFKKSLFERLKYSGVKRLVRTWKFWLSIASKLVISRKKFINDSVKIDEINIERLYRTFRQLSIINAKFSSFLMLQNILHQFVYV